MSKGKKVQRTENWCWGEAITEMSKGTEEGGGKSNSRGGGRWLVFRTWTGLMLIMCKKRIPFNKSRREKRKNVAIGWNSKKG